MKQKEKSISSTVPGQKKKEKKKGKKKDFNCNNLLFL